MPCFSIVDWLVGNGFYNITWQAAKMYRGIYFGELSFPVQPRFDKSVLIK